MENTYLTALHGMESFFAGKEDLLAQFHRKSYGGAFESFYQSKLPTFRALETGYDNAIEKEIYLSNMADALVRSATDTLEQVAKKHQRNNVRIDLNMMMVVYILPAIGKYQADFTQQFSDMILKKWKEKFPESNISAGSFEDIESGFHRKWCYITTAVCETLGKPDDCYELRILRDFRDHYLMSLDQGEVMIKEYYDVAPTIVKRINHCNEKADIYRNIWTEYLKPCIRMIETGENEECCTLYSDMVKNLRDIYFYNH